MSSSIKLPFSGNFPQCCYLITYEVAMSFKSFFAANPYICSKVGLFVLDAAIGMGIGSRCLYAADVGPDPGNHSQLLLTLCLFHDAGS